MPSNSLKKYIQESLENCTVKIFANKNTFIGTGFFISPDGYILTAWHCLEKQLLCGAIIYVEMTDINKSIIATLDEAKSLKSHDMAILKIKHTSKYCIPLGIIDVKNKGDEVVAVGYPAGEIEGRDLGIYEGIINQLLILDDLNIKGFETTAIEGHGQSGGLIYHYKSQKIIGFAQSIYNQGITQNTGKAIRFDDFFEYWHNLKIITKEVQGIWNNYLSQYLNPVNISRSAKKIPLDELKKQVDRGDNPDAFYQYGLRFETGDEVEKSYHEAKWWYEKAEKKGHAKASYRLALLHEKSLGGATQNSNEIIRLLTNAGRAGYSKAYKKLGEMHESGKLFKKNLDEAKECYKKATELDKNAP